ncbi:MAG: DUF5998 family protein [Actinomycetota bacterium]|nr:DUF5998 family protein [Actinomycetota bacterium]
MADRTPSSTKSAQADRLREAIVQCGYYPTVVAEAVDGAVAGEAVVDFVLHHEPTFDRDDEVRRHVTVVVLTPTRLLVAHTDEHPPDDLLPSPYASTSTEAVPLSTIRSVVTNRMVADPASYAGQPSRQPEANEAVLTIGWGAVNRVDLEPAGCGDPECEADHGYAGTMTADDFSLRMSATADGADAVARLLTFAQSLSAATTTVR